jgi:flagellar hook-length control protein FliK
MEAQDKPASPAEAADEPEAGPPTDPRAEDSAAHDIDTLLELCGAPAAETDGDAIAGSDVGPAPASPASTMSVPVMLPAPPRQAPVPATAGRGEPPTERSALQGIGGMSTDAATLAAVVVPDDRGGSRDTAEGTGATDLPESPLGGATVDGRTATRVGSGEPATAGRAPELRAPVGTPAWADELGARVTWMVERGEQVASLRLSPENLGPLEVRIAVREGETTVWFGAAQADTRAALEQSLPRLREMLGASGLALANAGVFSQTPRDPQRGFTAAALARASQESGAEAVGATVTPFTGRGLVDLYA